MTGLSIVLSSHVVAQDVIFWGNIDSVDGNYDSVGVDNVGSLNISGNMNISGPFTNKHGGSVHVTMRLNIFGNILTATNAGTLTAGSYWSDGHFINSRGAVASLGVMKSSGNVTNTGTLLIAQESKVADFNGSGGTTDINVTHIDYFTNMKPLLSATGKIRLDSNSKIVINVSEDVLTSSLYDVVIAASGDELEFNHSSENHVLIVPIVLSLLAVTLWKLIDNIQMFVYGIRADFIVKRK